MVPDGELLRRYAEEGSQAAFTELAQRHVHAIYRAALRRVGGNAHAADDVVQRVFADLARKVRRLRGRASLAGWLHTGTRFAAADAVRSERRRRLHEAEAHAAEEILAEDPPLAAERLEPILDPVLDLLTERDREAVLLHYLEGKSFVEIASTLSLSPDAVRMRVNRALDRLRTGLAARGVTSSAAALAAALSVQARPLLTQSQAAVIVRRALERAAVSGAAAAAKLAPLAWSGGAAAIVILGWFAFRGFHGRQAQMASPPPIEIASRPASTSEESEDVSTFSGAGAAQAIPASNAVSAAARAAPAAISGGFEGLSEPEKHILKILWQLNPQGPARVGLHVGRAAPNAADFMAGRDPLLAKGLVELGRNPSIVRLTRAGLEFCRANQPAIEAYPDFYHLARPQS